LTSFVVRFAVPTLPASSSTSRKSLIATDFSVERIWCLTFLSTFRWNCTRLKGATISSVSRATRSPFRLADIVQVTGRSSSTVPQVVWMPFFRAVFLSCRLRARM
jgi:hypothetical protein